MNDPAPISLVTATPEALSLIQRLRERHGPLMFHQSGGCCDGSSPMCYSDGELIVGEQDVYLGEIGGQPFYIGVGQYRSWYRSQLEIDLVPGRGGMFSLEGPEGVRFHTRSHLFSEDDWWTICRQRPDIAGIAATFS